MRLSTENRRQTLSAAEADGRAPPLLAVGLRIPRWMFQ